MLAYIDLPWVVRVGKGLRCAEKLSRVIFTSLKAEGKKDKREDRVRRMGEKPSGFILIYPSLKK